MSTSPVTIHIAAYDNDGAVTEQDVIDGTGTGLVSKAVLGNAISLLSYDYGSGVGGEPALANGSTNFFWAIVVDSAGNRSALRGPVEGVTTDTLVPNVTSPAVTQTADTYEFVISSGTVEENAITNVDLWLILSDVSMSLSTIEAINGGDLDGALETASKGAIAHPGSFASVAVPALKATRYFTSGSFSDISETVSSLYGHIVSLDGSGNKTRTLFGPFAVQDYTPPSGTVFLEKSRYPTDTLSFRYLNNVVDAGSGVDTTVVLYNTVEDISSGTVASTSGNTQTLTVSTGQSYYGFVRATDVAGNVYETPTNPAFIEGIVETNLLLYLDSNNENSYPQSGTTWENSINNPTYFTDIGSVVSLTNDVNSGGIALFNGTGGIVVNGAPLPLGSDFTLEIVFKSTSVRTVQDLFTIYPDGFVAGRAQIAYVYSTQSVWMFLGAAGGATETLVNTGDNSAAWNEWNHFVLRRVSNTFEMYVNNVLGVSVTVSPGFTFANSSQVLGEDSSPSSSRPFGGYMPAVKIYDRSLSTSELTRNFDSIRGRFGIN